MYERSERACIHFYNISIKVHVLWSLLSHVNKATKDCIKFLTEWTYNDRWICVVYVTLKNNQFIKGVEMYERSEKANNLIS